MKRILFFLLATVLTVGGGLAWVFLSDSPEKVIKDGIARLVAMRGARVVQADVSWTNDKAKSTTGFTYSGAIGLTDQAKPDVSGQIRVGAGHSGSEDQTGDIVAVEERVALRPRSVGPAWRAAYETFVGVTTGRPYVEFERSTLLEALDRSDLMTEAKSEDLRAALAFFVPVAVPSGPIMQVQSSAGELAVVDFKLDRRGLNPFLHNLLKTWYGRSPTAEELVIVDRVVQSAGVGTYRLAINKATRAPVQLIGNFPYVDAAGKSTPIRVRFTLGFQGVDETPVITFPSGTVDATLGLEGPSANISLPSARNVTGTVPVVDLGTDRSFGQIVSGKQIDAYDTYVDTLNKRIKQIQAAKAPKKKKPAAQPIK